MKIKEFEALNLKDCLQQVRREMGPEAVILETRKYRKGGVMGLGARDAVKIVAATGVSVQEPEARRPMKDDRRPTEDDGRRTTDDRRPTVDDRRLTENERRPAVDDSPLMGRAGLPAAASNTLAAAPAQSREADEKILRMEKELSELRNGIAAIREAVVASPENRSVVSRQSSVVRSHPSAVTPESLHPELYQRLIDAELPEPAARELLGLLPDLSGWSGPARAPLAEAALRDVMAGRVQTAGAIRLEAGKTRVVALIGPTGVGKTTTIAKLAAEFALKEKKRVGLITMDTYRIAAVEQLKTYSQIIDIPIRVAYTTAEIGPALESFAGFDLVLIDTAGRSQKNLMQVSELKSLVEAAGCETHLVLAASTKERDLLDQIARFGGAQIDRLVFTKLDETTSYGTLYSIAMKAGIPVSYITTGQKVPEDIEAADGQRLAGLVMNG